MEQKLHILDHPILKHKLSYLRDCATSSAEFRGIMKEISRILAYEATKTLSTKKVDVQTPMATVQAERVIDIPIVISIMRAGNGMLDGILSMLPFAGAGHMGIYRDKFVENTVEYYFKSPDDLKGRSIILADPLMATGDTIIATVDRLKMFEAGHIKLITVMCSRESVERLEYFHPDVEIFTISADEKLAENGYLIPGLGDAGNRLYQSK